MTPLLASGGRQELSGLQYNRASVPEWLVVVSSRRFCSVLALGVTALLLVDCVSPGFAKTRIVIVNDTATTAALKSAQYL